MFIPIGIITLGIVVAITCIYYFCRRGRFNLIGSWFIIMAVVFLFCFGVGFGYTYHKYNTGDMPNWVVYGIESVCNPNPIDEYGEQAPCTCEELEPIPDAQEVVGVPECLLFGLANAIIAIILFVIISIIIKRWSFDCKHTPFKSVILVRK